ncbi:MAG: hypothetical protein JXR83_09095 [Deltaproteobacteria bacterium]|nr:hypothetical protein [Deltaproteobacteria bacterium]
MADARLEAKREQHQKVELNRDDIVEMMHRASPRGPMSREMASGFNYLRVHYADRMSKDAAFGLDQYLSNWISAAIQEQTKRDKDKAREKKAQSQIERIEQHHEYLREWRAEVEQRMRALEIDDKQRVVISQFFNLRHDV